MRRGESGRGGTSPAHTPPLTAACPLQLVAAIAALNPRRVHCTPCTHVRVCARAGSSSGRGRCGGLSPVRFGTRRTARCTAARSGGGARSREDQRGSRTSPGWSGAVLDPCHGASRGLAPEPSVREVPRISCLFTARLCSLSLTPASSPPHRSQRAPAHHSERRHSGP